MVFAPRHAHGVGVFDPTNDSFSLVDIRGTIDEQEKFYAPLWRATAGWCSPLVTQTAWGVRSTDNSRLVDISTTINMDFKFSDAAAVGDGRVVFAPSEANGVGVFDPTMTASLVDISDKIAGTANAKFDGAAVAGDGSGVRPFRRRRGGVRSN